MGPGDHWPGRPHRTAVRPLAALPPRATNGCGPPCPRLGPRSPRPRATPGAGPAAEGWAAMGWCRRLRQWSAAGVHCLRCPTTAPDAQSGRRCARTEAATLRPKASWGLLPSLPASLRSGRFLSHPPPQVGIEKALDVAVHHRLKVALQVAGAGVFHALVGMLEVVADL